MSNFAPLELPPRPRPQPIRTYYFAFGSNLALQQMATRCPNSKYIGRATLKHFRWQINQRGYANVVPCHGFWVEGLVYEIDAADERRLDKSEGVAKTCVLPADCSSARGGGAATIEAPCYRKEYRSVLVHRAPKALYRRPIAWIVEKGGPARILTDALKEGGTAREFRGTAKEGVLVYLSPEFVREGAPKQEYVKRINSGIRDARMLGMTDEYVDYFVRQYVPPDGQPTAGTHVYPLKPSAAADAGEERKGTGDGVGRGRSSGPVRRQASSYEEMSEQRRVRDRPDDDGRPGTSSGRMPARSQSLREGRNERGRAYSVEGWVRAKTRARSSNFWRLW